MPTPYNGAYSQTGSTQYTVLYSYDRFENFNTRVAVVYVHTCTHKIHASSKQTADLGSLQNREALRNTTYSTHIHTHTSAGQMLRSDNSWETVYATKGTHQHAAKEDTVTDQSYRMDMQDIRECAYVCETNMNSFQNETMYVDNILILYHIRTYICTYTIHIQ